MTFCTPLSSKQIFARSFASASTVSEWIDIARIGVGYVALEGDPTPMRVRFSFLDDQHIRDMAHTYGRLRVIDGEATEGGAA